MCKKYEGYTNVMSYSVALFINNTKKEQDAVFNLLAAIEKVGVTCKDDFRVKAADAIEEYVKAANPFDVSKIEPLTDRQIWFADFLTGYLDEVDWMDVADEMLIKWAEVKKHRQGVAA